MAEELEELPGLVARPRKLLLMVKAGQPVDAVLERLLPCLEPGDVVIDGGNSHWSDTARRQARAKAAGVPIVSAMGAGNKLDPTRLEATDIYKTSVCPLARTLRRELRLRGIKELRVVYSREEPLRLTADNSNGRHAPASAVFVPAAMGIMIAKLIVCDISGLETA